MTKREEIDSLRSIVLRLIERVETLEAQAVTLLEIAARQKEKESGAKSYKEIQDDWNNRYNTISDAGSALLPRQSRFDKGPEPFAHPRRGVGD